MKRKIIAVILVLCLVAVFAAPGSVAAGNVCFTAINDTLNPLDNNTMPVIIGSLLYVPSTFFSFEGLSVQCYTSNEQVIIYRGLKILVFDTVLNIVVDQDNVKLNITAVKQNGLIYIPLDEVRDFFGLTYQVISSNPAPVVRFVNRQDVNTMSEFINANRAKMQIYYTAYIGSGAQPGVSPAPTEKTYENVAVYLGFFDLAPKNFETVLNTLDLYRFKCCFFVSADEIASDAALLRRAAGSGHSVGLWLREGTFDEYQSAVSLLCEAAKIRSVIVSAPESATEAAQAMAASKGLVFWKPTRTYDEKAGSSFNDITEDLSVLYGSREGLNFACPDNSVPVLINFLTYLSGKRYTVRRIVENTAPIYSVA